MSIWINMKKQQPTVKLKVKASISRKIMLDELPPRYEPAKEIRKRAEKSGRM